MPRSATVRTSSISAPYSAFLHTIPDAALVVTGGGRVVHASARAEALLGFGATTLVDTSLERHFSSGGWTALASLLAEAIATRRGLPMGRCSDLVARRRDGTEFPVDVALQPSADSNNRLVACFVRDRTERSRLELVSRMHEAQARWLSNRSSDVFYSGRIISRRSVLDFVSAQAERVCGHPASEFVSDPSLWQRLLHPDDAEAVRDASLRIFRRRKEGLREYRVWNPARKEYAWIEDRLTPVHSEDGSAVGFNGIARDVTALRNAALEMQVVSVVSAELREAQSRREMPRAVLGQLQRMLRADGAALATKQPNGHTLIEYAIGSFASGTGTELPRGVGVSGYVIETGKPFVQDDARTDSRFTRPDLLRDAPAVACMPLIVEDEVIGALFIGRVEPISDREVMLLRTVVEILASALHKASLNERIAEDAAALARAYETTLEGWTKALDLRDRETEGHTQRVTQLTLRLAGALGFSADELTQVRRGALLHDIGKIGVPDAILHKPGPLDTAEWEIMRRHPTYAHDLLSPIAYLRPALEIPYCHHERWDGTGYPRGLRGAEIPLSARIFSVVDVWDAIRYSRPYRAALSRSEARHTIRAGSGTHFEPRIVDAFLDLEMTLQQNNADEV